VSDWQESDDDLLHLECVKQAGFALRLRDACYQAIETARLRRELDAFLANLLNPGSSKIGTFDPGPGRSDVLTMRDGHPRRAGYSGRILRGPSQE
jgi:hypothetical protein